MKQWIVFFSRDFLIGSIPLGLAIPRLAAVPIFWNKSEINSRKFPSRLRYFVIPERLIKSGLDK